MGGHSKPRCVVIVGAGAAGLEAANILLTHQKYAEGALKVILLEARDRVGGRICIHENWDAPFDLGISSLFTN
jgi:monoamine oxidase